MILDTNALSAIADGETGAINQVSKPRELAIPVIVLGEYRFGIAQSRRKSEYERWLGMFLSVCNALLVNVETTIRYADVRLALKRMRTPSPANDVWIAALCLQYDEPILSQDSHFDFVPGVRRVSWKSTSA
ncbi:MAG: type II toxin-antitoxin system VapC family toxin [Bryobacteraceae bacterium]